jgi:glycosyltransferase involved in cell wall biosynthesis
MLEAIAAGVPVVAATGSCLEEAGGPGAIYVDPTSVGDFTDAIRSLIDDAALRRRMVADGRRHIARFAGENFGADLVKVYQSML